MAADWRPLGNGKPNGCGKKKPEELHLSEDQADADESIEGQIKAGNSMIESFCRRLMKLAEECPTDPWLEYHGRRDGALRKIKDACEALRTAKCCKPCPQCDGQGCRICLKTGTVPKAVFDQVS
jgi:hypothetical protein